MALKLYSISLKDFAVKISVAKRPAHRLARDGADHEERHERELVRHFEHNKDRSNWRPHHGSQTCTHSSHCESNPIVRFQVQNESTKVCKSRPIAAPKKSVGENIPPAPPQA